MRVLSKAANANISALKYHLGGKDAFFLACIDTVAKSLSRAGPEQFLPTDIKTAHHLFATQAVATLRLIIGAVLKSAFDADRAEYVRFLHSQRVIDGRGMDRFVQTTLGRHYAIFSALVAKAEARAPQSDVTKARALAIMMQTISMVRSERMLALMLGWDTPKTT